MKYKLFLAFLVALSFLAAIVHAEESSLDSVSQEIDSTILCKSIPLPSDELWKKCESEGLVPIQQVENGCVVGYYCGQVSDPSPEPVPPVRDPSSCVDIAPPSEELCTKCHDAGMIVQKNIQKGCVVGYECVENLYMGPLPPADACVVNVPCPPVKPPVDVVNECELKGGVFSVYYNDKCEAKFECNFSSAIDPAPSPGPAPYTNNSVGCPVVDVPEDFKSKCDEKSGTVVVRYDANCNAKFYCIERPLIGPPVPAPSVGIAPSLTPAPIRDCEVDPALVREFNDIVKQLRERTTNARDEDNSALKQKLARLTMMIREQKQKCAGTTNSQDVAPQGVAVGVNCRVPPELQKELLDAWNAYRELLKSPNDVDLTAAKRRISDVTLKISEYRKTCAADIVPGQTGAVCVIPEDLMKRLEVLYKQYSDLEKSMQASQEQLENIKKMINDLEKQLLEYRARCTRLPIDSGTTTANIAKYYAQRISDISSDNPDEQLAKLKELRAEVDETLKDLIEQRKSMKFEELSEMVDEITLKPGSVEIGDAVAQTADVEIQTEVEGSTVSVSTKEDSVVINQDGLVVEASEVSVSNSGLSVEGSQIVPPNRLLAVKVLERNKERIQKLKLERREASLVYNAQLQAKMKVLGIIPVMAQQTVTVNAETGEVVTQEKPWWTSISTNAK